MNLSYLILLVLFNITSCVLELSSLLCCKLLEKKEDIWYSYVLDPPKETSPMAESEEELKNLLIKVKQESEKVGLKLSFQKTKIMASSPITSWQIDGETVADYFWGAPTSLQMVIAAMKLKDAYSLEGKL